MRITLLPFLAYYHVVFFVPVDGKGGRSECYSMPQEDDDNCETDVSRWYYNKEEGKCVTFMYGECPRGSNNFNSDEACTQACKNAGSGPMIPQRPIPPPKRPERPGPSKGGRPWNKRPPKKGSEGENETGPGGWPTKGPGSGGWKPQKRPPKPHWPPYKPPKKWPKPPSKKPGSGSCAARMRKKKGCGDFEGMWFNNAPFVTCSRVRKGACPTVGAFFPSCEECMGACYRHRIKQCAYMV
uniref:Putative bovine pancreatic trypsin inhibitor n=1 Tax=Rhipicephalus microplus TaxID=6941 RepID=A0A6G5A7M9_RHIMP